MVSDKMDKTVVVKVTSIKTHSKYKKQYKASKRYKAPSRPGVIETFIS